MWGCFVFTTSPDWLAEGPSTGDAFVTMASHNVAPHTQGVLTVLEDGGARRLEVFHWGLVPFWTKGPIVGNRLLNARAETVTEKNLFKRPFITRRCIIPTDGFREWRKTAGVGGK